MNIRHPIGINKANRTIKVLLALLLGLSISLFFESSQFTFAQGTGSVETESFGGNGGKKFTMIPVTTSIGLRTGDRVNSIKINDKQFGNWKNSSGGKDKPTLIFDSDEYISKVDICFGSEIDAVYFTTNKGRSIGGGKPCNKRVKGRSTRTLEGIRVLQIGGRVAERVDKLEIMYVKNYQPSEVIERNVGFIAEFTPPNTEINQYLEETSRDANMYESLIRNVITNKVSASVQGEYYAQVSSTVDISVESFSQTTVKQELEKIKKQGNSKKVTIPTDSVGILIFNGNLMRGANNEFWPNPTTRPSFLILKLTDSEKLIGNYDLTRTLHVQMSDLKKYNKTKNTLIYYGN